MAIAPKDDVLNTNGASAAYPQGSAKNVSVSGAGDGTPWEKKVIDDIWGFLQTLLDSGSVTPNNSADSVTNPQYVEALINFMATRAAVGNTNDNNMGNYSGTVLDDNQTAKFNIQQVADFAEGITPGVGDMTKAVYDPGNINANAFNVANHSGAFPSNLFTLLTESGVVQAATDVDVNNLTSFGSTGARLSATPLAIANGNLLAGRNGSGINGFYNEGLMQSSSRLKFRYGRVNNINIPNNAAVGNLVNFTSAFSTIRYGIWYGYVARSAGQDAVNIQETSVLATGSALSLGGAIFNARNVGTGAAVIDMFYVAWGR